MHSFNPNQNPIDIKHAYSIERRRIIWLTRSVYRKLA